MTPSAFPIPRPLLIALIALWGALLGLGAFVDTLDAQLRYTAEEALALPAAIGPTGRLLYGIVVACDFTFIACYTAALYLFFRDEARHTPRLGPVLLLLPWALAAFDVAETASVAGLLLTFPDPEPVFARIAAFATPPKWTLAVVSLALLVRSLLRRRLGRQRAS